MSYDVSIDQRNALNGLWEWLKYKKNQDDFITLGGYAGTGKTTCLAIFRKYLKQVLPKWKIGFASYTGKASRVLSGSLKKYDAIYEDDFLGTIHSLIYAPITDSNKNIVGWKLKKTIPFNLIIIDEASMIDKELWKDLRSFAVPIIAAGDHGQLPPIQGSFNLMQKPILKLENIHRQAQGNPIIKLSQMARNDGKIPVGDYGIGVRKFSLNDLNTGDYIESQVQQFSTDTLVLCGYNHTRIRINSAVRIAKGFDDPHPQSKDRVICLRNNREKDIYNGMIGTIRHLGSANENWYNAEIIFDGEEDFYSGLISKSQFNSKQIVNTSGKQIGDFFDFGYALTVHKAQGSQARKVLLFEERFKQMDDESWRRWLYTGVTRAEEELYIFGT